MSARPLVLNPRPRTPRFRPPPGPAVLALYPRHVALAALVAGLLAGPRSAVAAALLAGAALGAAVALVRAGGDFRVPLERAEDAELDLLVPDRPTVTSVPVARAGVALGLAALAVLAGAALAAERLAALDHTTLAVPRADAEVRAFVAEAPRTLAFGTTLVRARVAVGSGAGELVLLRVPSHAGAAAALAVGDEVVARGDLRALRDREAYDRRRHVHGVVEVERLVRTGRTRGSPVDAVRRRAEAALDRGLRPEPAALARGMVLGQDQALPDDLRDAFQVAGLAHLLAASGQNVMLLATLVLAVATAAGVGLRARLGLTLVAITFYVPLAGGGASIQRAGIMGAAGLVAALAGRPASRWYAVLLAAAATLVLDPNAALDVGWQLSFAAVIAILALHRRLRAALRGGDRDPARLARGGALRALRAAAADATADVAALTIAATLGTAPLLCLYFEELSLISLPANLLAAPAVAPVMWLGTLAGALGGEPARLLCAASELPLGYLAWLGRTAAALPHASVPVTLPGPVAVVALYAALGAACLVRLGERPRRWLLRSGLAAPAAWTLEARAAGLAPRIRPRWATVAPLGAVLAATGLALTPGPPAPPSGPALSMLDVGQGDALLLQDGDHAALFDTGKPGAPLVRELRRAGVRRLDVLVLTHSSADHEGGLAALLRAVPVGMVLDGRGAGLEHGGEGGSGRFEGLPPGLPRDVPARGQRFAVGRIAVEIVWPPPGDQRAGDPNATATVALARTATASALLTADAESPVTLGLDLPPVDVLKVAHHGSADPGLETLLERLRPKVALVPVGENTYGHPAPETLAALRAAGAQVRRADRDGTVRIGLGG